MLQVYRSSEKILIRMVVMEISAIIDIARAVVQLAEAAQRSRLKCTQLKEQVHMIILLLAELESQWTPDPVTSSMLQNLNAALIDGKALVESCQKKRTWSRFFGTQKNGKMFEALEARISRILEQFHVANMILIVSINKERFFMNVLEKLLRYGACRLLPQSEKEELKEAIKTSVNTYNMSSDAKRVLEWIIRDITHGDGATTSSSSVRPGGSERTSNGHDHLTEVGDLAVFIVRKAKELRQHRKEIEQLVKFVEQVADLMQGPQSTELSADPRTRPIVTNLKHDLDHVYDIVLHNEHNIIARAIHYGVSWRQTQEILKAAYKIENYVHVLSPYVDTMRQKNDHQEI